MLILFGIQNVRIRAKRVTTPHQDAQYWCKKRCEVGIYTVEAVTSPLHKSTEEFLQVVWCAIQCLGYFPLSWFESTAMLHNTDGTPSTSVFFNTISGTSTLLSELSPYFQQQHLLPAPAHHFRHKDPTSDTSTRLRHQHPTSCTSTLLPSPEFLFRRLGPYFRRHQHPTAGTRILLPVPPSFFQGRQHPTSGPILYLLTWILQLARILGQPNNNNKNLKKLKTI